MFGSLSMHKESSVHRTLIKCMIYLRELLVDTERVSVSKSSVPLGERACSRNTKVVHGLSPVDRERCNHWFLTWFALDSRHYRICT